MVPDAPILLSTITAVDNALASLGANILATISLPVPDVVGTTRVIFLVGATCARVPEAHNKEIIIIEINFIN
jgi:hypothetical protein